MNISQKGNSLIIVLVGILVLLLIGGAYYYGKQSSSSITQPIQSSVISPTQTPVQSYNSSDINNFPVYPNSQYIKSQVNDPCPTGGAGGFAICGTTTYTWSSADNFTAINDWYKQDKSQSGWKCTGGAGQYSDPDNASGQTACVKGSFNYGLNIETTSGHSTITLSVPNKPTISPTPTSIPAKKLNYNLPSGWKTVKDPTGNFEIGYDPNYATPTYPPPPEDKEISFGLVNTTCLSTCYYIVSIGSYDGGSRHQTIYNQLGINDPASSQSKDYHEDNFSYNGWNCLVMYGLSFSAYFDTWGICPISSSQAIYLDGEPPNWGQIIQTIKLLK